MDNKIKTLILGASINPSRYSYKAAMRLACDGYPFVMIGREKNKIGDMEILDSMVQFDDIHTVTIYLSPENQKMFYQYVISLNPKRVIFNPGAENEDFTVLLEAKNIEVVEACTLVLLATQCY